MKAYKEWIFHTLLILHFGLVLSHNGVQSIKSYNDLYYKDKPFYESLDTWVSSWIKRISFFDAYQELTGTDSGYGFYAPQVASDIEPFFDVYNGQDKIADHFNFRFSNKEAAVRFESVFSQHLEKLDEALDGKELCELNEKPYFRFLDLRMHSLCTYVFNNMEKADRIMAKLYLYDVPGMHDCIEYGVPFYRQFIKTFEYEYGIK